jgi:ABC-type transport system involved in cytochrome c biogenesis permease subunit
MMPELWLAVSALLLGLAAMAGGLAIFKVPWQWDLIAVGARVVGTVALAVALGLTASAEGEWSPYNSRQVILSLILAMLVIHQILAWHLRIGSAGPIADLVALVLIPVAVFAVQADAPPLACMQRAGPFQAQWALYLLGGGGVLVAGSAGLMLAFGTGKGGHGRDLQLPNRTALYNLLIQAMFLGLVALGGGLTMGVWWAWVASGGLSGGDPRQVWMAITWLAAAMSLLAWQLDAHRARWAGGLAVVAAGSMLFGLLFLVDLQQIVGM